MPRGVSTFPRHLEHFHRIEDDTVPSLSRLRSNMVTCGRHENMQENMKRGFRGTGLARKLMRLSRARASVISPQKAAMSEC